MSNNCWLGGEIMADSFLRTKQEETQFTQLLQAIRSGGGGGGSSDAYDITYNETTVGLELDLLSSLIGRSDEKVNIVTNQISWSSLGHGLYYLTNLVDMPGIQGEGFAKVIVPNENENGTRIFIFIPLITNYNTNYITIGLFKNWSGVWKKLPLNSF